MKLGRWIDKQRQRYKKNSLKADRQKLLQILVDSGRCATVNILSFSKSFCHFKSFMYSGLNGKYSLAIPKTTRSGNSSTMRWWLMESAMDTTATCPCPTNAR